MKPATAIRLRIWLGWTLVVGPVLWLGTVAWLSIEPAWQGHPLSEWLEAYDTNWRFDEGDGRRSQFSDVEIEHALEGIGPAALPSLRRWIKAKPSRLKDCANRLLNRQGLIHFRFPEGRDLQSLAEVGFMYYGSDAQPLLPELIELSHSKDLEDREFAYEAAFFTRPPREILLPLATRALSEQDGGVRAMAAQWLRERFPDAAKQSGLHDQSLLPFIEQAVANTSSNEP